MCAGNVPSGPWLAVKLRADSRHGFVRRADRPADVPPGPWPAVRLRADACCGLEHRADRPTDVPHGHWRMAKLRADARCGLEHRADRPASATRGHLRIAKSRADVRRTLDRRAIAFGEISRGHCTLTKSHADLRSCFGTVSTAMRDAPSVAGAFTKSRADTPSVPCTPTIGAADACRGRCTLIRPAGDACGLLGTRSKVEAGTPRPYWHRRIRAADARWTDCSVFGSTADVRRGLGAQPRALSWTRARSGAVAAAVDDVCDASGGCVFPSTARRPTVCGFFEGSAKAPAMPAPSELASASCAGCGWQIRGGCKSLSLPGLVQHRNKARAASSSSASGLLHMQRCPAPAGRRHGPARGDIRRRFASPPGIGPDLQPGRLATFCAEPILWAMVLLP